jgi:hypothetical protein
MTITNGAGGLTVCAELVDELSIARHGAQLLRASGRNAFFCGLSRRTCSGYEQHSSERDDFLRHRRSQLLLRFTMSFCLRPIFGLCFEEDQFVESSRPAAAAI